MHTQVIVHAYVICTAMHLAKYVYCWCHLISVLPICFTVTAQEGPGKVTAHPGQDVELLCTVTEDSTALTEGWLVNNMGPYKINAIHHGILSGHNASMDGGNLMVQNITTNDNRSGSEYICVIIPAEGSVTIADIIYWSDPTFLYVSGEYRHTYNIIAYY